MKRFISQSKIHEVYDEALSQLGFCKISNNRWFQNLCKLQILIVSHKILSVYYRINKNTYVYQTDNLESAVSFIIRLKDRLYVPDESIIENESIIVVASITSRELTKNLVRVKSSNLWARCINIKDNRSKCGDMIIQFKDKNGGPGDVYEYFDVPVGLWRKFLTAPSAGHFFWKYFRNNFSYRKLTGDKRGKLPNAIN